MPLLNLSATPDSVHISWRLAVPASVVRKHLTSPPLLSEWLGRAVDADLRVDGQVAIDHGDGYLCRSRVTEFARPERLTLTWKFPDELETAVAFDLDEADAGCVVRLTHSGLGELAESYAQGWPVHLTYLEGSVLGAPLPSSQFWNLHETMCRLVAGDPSVSG